MSGTLSVVANIYQVAVHLYPPDFRREFASEMTRDFRQATDEAWLQGAWPGVISVWTYLSVDFVRTLILQWCRSAWTVIALFSATFSVVGIGAAAQLLHAGPLAQPDSPADRDLLMLILLVTAVLVVIAATIIVTVLFARPRMSRTRR
jgi:hypothetical protein